MPLSVLILLPVIALLVSCGGNPPASKGAEPSTKSSNAPSQQAAASDEPAADVPDIAALNSQSRQNFEEMLVLLEGAGQAGKPFPAHVMFIENEIMNGQVPTNPFTQTPMKPEPSFVGSDPGDYSYSAIVMPDGTQAGFVFLGYGDTGADGPSEEDTDTFFEARNWVEYNGASTDPRLPNDVPARTIAARLVIKEGIGKTPPADYEAPPQESLVDRQLD
ncbi:MAG: hypothetical protein GEEBNDBF_00335 [bacterium]|nr:hypothetical protein [bacterium]